MKPTMHSHQRKGAFLLFLLFKGASLLWGQNTAYLTIRDTAGPLINRNIYGQFAEDMSTCIYGGLWQKDHYRMDVVDALKKIKIPVLRWPGGCFADQYHWRDGIGPIRKKGVNATWGMVKDDNSFGTHEFMQLCKLLGCEPYIGANVGSGTPEEMMDWLEYLNYNDTSDLTELRRRNGHPQPFKVSFWGVGNESWGCGGSMTPEYYSNLYRRFARYCKSYPGAPLKLIASGADGDDYNWTEIVMKSISLRRTWGLSLHYYAIPDSGGRLGSASKFGEDLYFSGLAACLKIEDIINKHTLIMNKYDPGKKIALVVDEWGIVTEVEPGTDPDLHYQQNSLRDALIAGTTLNIFNNHCDRIKMANIAQILNVVQALVLTKGDKMLLTPTYYVYDLYTVHQDAHSLVAEVASPDYEYVGHRIPAVNASASRDSSGTLHISLVNLDPSKKITIRTVFRGISFQRVSGQVLTSLQFDDVNHFDQAPQVRPAPFYGARKNGSELIVEMPAKSLVVLELQ